MHMPLYTIPHRTVASHHQRTNTMTPTDTHELVYIAFDVVYLAGKGAAEVFQRANLAPCAVRGSM